MSLESSDPTKIESDHPHEERTHQKRELSSSGSSIDEKLEKVSLVEVGDTDELSNDLIGSEKNDPTKLKNEVNDDVDEQESGEDSSSEEEENEESSSDESSSSSSSGCDGEEEDKGKGDEVAKLEEGEMEREQMFVDSDDEEVVTKGPIKSKHEVQDLPPVPPVDVSLEPYHKTMPVGVISSILGNIVLVEGSETHSALNEGSIIWITETRSPLGIIDEIFGPVKNPYYVIRFNSGEDIPRGTSVGAAVSFVSEFAEHILNQKDLYKKGYDASGDNDEEVGDEVEFSDDEKEAEYKRSMRQEKRGTTNVDHDSGFGKRTNYKGAGFRKDKQPPVSLPPLAAAACHQLGSQVQTSNIGWIPENANPGRNVNGGPPTMMMQTCPPHPQAFQMGIGNPSQQLNSLWQHGFPPHRPESIGLQEGAFVPQLGQQQAYNPHYHQFHFNQALNMFASGLMPYMQQQVHPNAGVHNLPLFVRPASALTGQPSPPPVVTMGQGGLGQVPLECSSNVNNPQGTNLASFNEQRHPQASPMYSNRGRSLFRGRGRRPYQRGRLSYGGRGQKKNG